jgi:hypothetical protein
MFRRHIHDGVGLILYVQFHDIILERHLHVLDMNGNAAQTLLKNLIVKARRIDFNIRTILFVRRRLEYNLTNVGYNRSANCICKTHIDTMESKCERIIFGGNIVDSWIHGWRRLLWYNSRMYLECI